MELMFMECSSADNCFTCSVKSLSGRLGYPYGQIFIPQQSKPFPLAVHLVYSFINTNANASSSPALPNLWLLLVYK